MFPGEYKFKIYRGGTWSQNLAGTDAEDAAYDFSIYDEVRMQIKAAYIKGSSAAIKEFSIASGHIELADAGYTIVITISAAETAALTFKEGKYEIELIVDAAGEEAEIVHKFLMGSLSVIGEVL